ncbi:outer membrane receptor protein involved in Fe transport [Xanthomonas sacchari]|uniref:TonB-dependent receptor n=1 Tax=Xanthomonas sacchari TaxID=56458 RepID=UPI0027836926|nr:outer membrane receptor protein involved in Fe transport [Xanthomonas sacchari]
MSKHYPSRVMRRSVLAVLLGAALTQGVVHAQSTTGSIYGVAPAGATITVQSDTGLTRTVPVDSAGRFNIGSLPVGTYTVTLNKDGQAVDSRKGIGLRVSSGTEVSFAKSDSTATLDTVTVSASNVAPVDVTTVDSRTVITAEQLQRLPLARSAEAIALLAPGAVAGSGYFGNAVSFGGAGVSENAYYVNGFSTGNPINNIGGVSLPYGAIDQQEVYTGGYSARYGRSDGGVISQIGKRGTNEWHFGGQVLWRPRATSESPKDVYYPDASLPSGYGYQDPTLTGKLYRSRKDNPTWSNVYSAYAGGPLIEDRLFVFVSAEQEKIDGVSTTASDSSTVARNHWNQNKPKVYAKLDWNINDSNLLELTGIKSNDRTGGYYNAFDYATLSEGARNTAVEPNIVKQNSTYYIGKYTSYLTEDLTFSATYGKSTFDNKNYPGIVSPDPYLSGVVFQNPAANGGTPIRNGQGARNLLDGKDNTRGLRLDFDYRLGNHDLAFGIDNIYYQAENEGQSMTGPGYAWYYAKSSRPNAPISSALGVGAPGGQGYYVRKLIFSTATSMTVKQKAYFLEDRWQVSDKVLLSLGLRNDKFINSNSNAQPYVDSGNQWAPRLGATWDVHGDSTLKVYANLGRYFLALPNSVAIRGASASTFTSEYFAYTGIDAKGNPTGLRPLGPGPVSSNGEYGIAPDPRTFTPSDLKSMYQDELIVGFDQAFAEKWTFGAKGTYRKLQSAIDDVCDPGRMRTKLRSLGVDPSTVTIPGCILFNPGETNSFSLANSSGGRTNFTMSKADWGFDSSAKRDYAALNLYLEHPFDGKWSTRVDYTWSRNFGNTEGQLKSNIGQTDVSKTQDWDAAALMAWAGGYLANDRRHQLKIYGAYQIAPEWMVSANLRIQSGTPRDCLGYFSANGVDESSVAGDPVGYRSAYHTCAGSASRPGDAGRTPWTKQIDLGAIYRPAFADQKLAFGLQVFNLLNERKPVQQYATWESSPYTVLNTYGMGNYFQTPRYLQLSVSYDY